MSLSHSRAEWASECARENNAIVHRIRNTQNSETPSSTLHEIFRQFQKLLCKVQGLPFNISTALLELTVAYNYLYLFRTCQLQQCTPEKIKEQHQLLQTTLSRVCSLHKNNSSFKTEELSADTSKWLFPAWQALAHTPKAGCAMMHLVCLYAVHLTLDGQQQSAQRLVEVLGKLPVTCSPISSQEQPPESDVTMVTEIFPTGNQCVSLVEARDLVCILLAMLRWLLSDMDGCWELLSSCSVQGYRVPSMLLQACVHYKKRRYDDCLKMLRTMKEEYAADMDTQQHALCYTYMGMCWAKKGLPHCAVESYRQALKENSACVTPLYFISVGYQSLGLADAETEALTLLVKSLRSHKESPKSGLIKWPGQELLRKICCHDIQYTQALYILASRCMNLHSYEMAAGHYLTLLSWLQKPGSDFQQNLDHGISLEVQIQAAEMESSVPDLRTLFYETAYALLKSHRYGDCVATCDHILAAYTQNTSLLKTPIQSNLLSDTSQQTPTGSGATDMQEGSAMRKRCHSDPDPCALKVKAYSVDLTALKTKSTALCASKQWESAIKSLNLVITIIEEEYVHNRNSDEPQQKRIKIGSTSCEAEARQDKDPVLQTLAWAYSCKGHVLHGMGKKRDALHCSRIALQLEPECDMIKHNHCVLLCQLDHLQEAKLLWRKTRKKYSSAPDFSVKYKKEAEEELIPLWDQDLEEHHLVSLDQMLLT